MSIHQPRPQIPWRNYIPEIPEGHDALASDLANYFRFQRRPWFVWENVTFSVGMCVDFARDEQWRENCDGHKWCRRRLYLERRDCRPDVLALRASCRVSPPVAYEIKVTRSDFLSDVRSEKWRIYQRVAPLVYFAVPNGLIDPREVPDEAGLIVRMKNHWRRKKMAKQMPWVPTDLFWMTLLYRGRAQMPWERPASQVQA